MDATGGHSQFLAAVEESLCSDGDIEFVVLFGSQITGESRPSSDLDIALKFADELSPHERFQKRCFLSGTLQRSDEPFVDVSDIDALPIDVAHDVAAGEFLCGNEQAFSDWKATIEATYEEQREDIRRHQRDVINRIAEGGLRG